MGILQSLFGGSKSSSGAEANSAGFQQSSGTSQQSSNSTSSSQSGNQSFDLLSRILSPVVGGGAGGFQQLGEELSGGFEGYKDKAGFNFLMDRGAGDITSNAAAKGLLNSGGTLKGLTKFATELGDTFYGNYLDKLGNFSQLGLGAASPLVGAGSFSNSAGNSSSSGQSQNSSYGEDMSTSSQWAKGKDSGKGIIGTLGSLF